MDFETVFSNFRGCAIVLISQKTTSANVVAAQSAALQQVCLSRGCIFWFPAHLTALFPMSTFRRLQLEVDGMRTSWRASRGAHQRCRRFLHQISSVPVTVFRIKEMEPRESNHGIWHALYRSMYIYFMYMVVQWGWRWRDLSGSFFST